MSETLYRRPLPADATEFSSPAGRALFAEALAAGGLDGYFPLAEQFHTQSDPAFCGLGSLVVAVFSRVESVAGGEHAEGVTLLLIAIADRLAPERRDELAALANAADASLANELANLRAQLAALWSITSGEPIAS